MRYRRLKVYIIILIITRQLRLLINLHMQKWMLFKSVINTQNLATSKVRVKRRINRGKRGKRGRKEIWIKLFSALSAFSQRCRIWSGLNN